MALTGIVLRRDAKASLMLDPPIDGELVFATDTLEHGAKIGNEIFWRSSFTSPALYNIDTLADLNDLIQKRDNDFCFIKDLKKLFYYNSNTWVEITEIDDESLDQVKTWSAQKISSRHIQGSLQPISLKIIGTSGLKPSVNDLEYGELVVNYIDGKVFLKKFNNSILTLIELTHASFIENTTIVELQTATVDTSLHFLATTKANINSPIFTGEARTTDVAQNDSSTKIANTKFVLNQASDELPQPNGSPNAGISTKFSRADHVHESVENIFAETITVQKIQNVVINMETFSTSTVDTLNHIIELCDDTVAAGELKIFLKNGLNVHSLKLNFVVSNSEIFQNEESIIFSNNGLGVFDLIIQNNKICLSFNSTFDTLTQLKIFFNNFK